MLPLGFRRSSDVVFDVVIETEHDVWTMLGAPDTCTRFSLKGPDTRVVRRLRETCPFKSLRLLVLPDSNPDMESDPALPLSRPQRHAIPGAVFAGC